MKRKVTKVTPKKRKPKALSGWEDRFLEVLRDWPNVTQAAKKAGVSRVEVYRTCKESTDFSMRFDEARRVGIEAVEDEAIDQTRTNPTLMIFMLKNLKPAVYADRHVFETWQDRVIALLRDRKVTVEDVATEFGADIASDLAIAAGLSIGASGEAGATGESTEQKTVMDGNR